MSPVDADDILFTQKSNELSFKMNTERIGILFPDAEILSRDVHNWCVGLLRQPDTRFSLRRELEFSSSKEAIRFIESSGFLGERCLCFGYSLEKDASFSSKTALALDGLRKNDTILSRDGVIITNIHVTGGFVLDFSDADDQSSVGMVYCSVVGEPALAVAEGRTRQYN